MSHPHDPIARFLESPAYGVVGASPRRHKYGNKVLRCYQQNGRRAIPVNPREDEVEGLSCESRELNNEPAYRSVTGAMTALTTCTGAQEAKGPITVRWAVRYR